MIGSLYDAALRGEHCWLRCIEGGTFELPVQQWLGGGGVHQRCDSTIVAMCDGPTLDFACGPGRFLPLLQQRGIRALGVDESEYAVHLANLRGGTALCADVFGPLPDAGDWRTVLLADGNVGIGGDPSRVLERARDLATADGHCIVEFDSATKGVTTTTLRVESADAAGHWFPWATVGLDALEQLGDRVGLRVKDVEVVGDRGVASMAVF